MGQTAMSPQEQPEGHVHHGPHTPEPATALGEGAVKAEEVKPLTPSETPGIGWCFVRELFLPSTPISAFLQSEQRYFSL